MSRARVILAALAGSAALSGCTTIGGNVKGNFSCVAPDGICAPSSVIDDRALAMISGEDGDRLIAPAGPYSAPRTEGRVFQTAAAPVRSQERVLRIVFPAQIDAAGRLHEQTAVHAVVERGDWQQALASNVVATSPAEVRAATGGDTLLAAINRAETPLVPDGDVMVDPDMPSAAAVAAARAQADPVGDIKDQVARRLAKAPRRLSVAPAALSAPPTLTYTTPAGTASAGRAGVTTPTAATHVRIGVNTSLTPLPTPAPVRPVTTVTTVTTVATVSAGTALPKYATSAGRNAVASVSVNPAIRAGLARAEPEARQAAEVGNPLPVLRASSFPGVDQ